MFPFPTTAEILNLDTLLYACRQGDGAQTYHHAEGDLKTMDDQITQQTPYPARNDPNAALSGNWQKSDGAEFSAQRQPSITYRPIRCRNSTVGTVRFPRRFRERLLGSTAWDGAKHVRKDKKHQHDN
jgi:hypothetical protein